MVPYVLLYNMYAKNECEPFAEPFGDIVENGLLSRSSPYFGYSTSSSTKNSVLAAGGLEIYRSNTNTPPSFTGKGEG